MRNFKRVLSLLCLMLVCLFAGVFTACETTSKEHTEHTFTTYVSDNNATCTNDGTKTATCDGCDAKDTITDVGSKIPHNFVTYVSNNDATCQQNATKTAVCEYNCGTSDTVEIENTRTTHNFKSYLSNNDANCQADGTKTAVCEYNCGATDTIIDAGTKGNHNFQNHQSNGDATCTADGTKTGYCTGNCGESETIADVGSKIPHNFEVYTYNEDATCTADGTKTAVCEYNCGTSDTITALETQIPHNFNLYIYNEDATCTNDGTKTASCGYHCGETDTVSAVDTKLSHDFQTYVPNGDATCQADGTKTASCRYNCGETDTVADIGSKTTHSYKNYQSNGDATCQADGTKTASCEYACGNTETVTDVGSKVGHSFTKYQSNNNATCTENATETAVCDFEICSETNTRTVNASALGHNFVLGECSRCEATSSLNVTKNPTVSAFYYGETPTLSAGTVKNESNAVVGGSWKIQTSEIQASGTSSNITVEVSVIFTPSSNAYAPLTIKVSTTMHAVALYNNAYYTSIDYALSQANSKNSGKVYALPLGYSLDTGRAKIAKTIKNTTEIKSGVSLILPYSTNEMDTNYSFVTPSQSNDYKQSSFGNSKYLLNQVFIATGVTLNNAGTITIAGVISGGASGNYSATANYANSVTAGNHGQILLSDNATLMNTGVVNCYGFINETSANNGSKVHVKSGTLTGVFSFVEYRELETYLGMMHPENPAVVDAIKSKALSALSGTAKYTPDTLEIFPFNRFYIGSIASKMRVDHNATVKGFIDLNMDGENNVATLSIINKDNGVIALKNSDAYVESKFTPSTRKTKLDIYGDMKLNPLNLTVKISKYVDMLSKNITVELTLTSGPVNGTEGVFLPISDLYEIQLNAVSGDATVDTTEQKIKLLPGSKLTVGAGVVLNASTIAIYQNNSLFQNGIDKHYTTNTSAQLIVCGALNAKAVGGTVKVGADDASLFIQNSTTVYSKEIKALQKGKTMSLSILTYSIDIPYAGVSYATNTETALYATGDTASANNQKLSASEYRARGGKWHSLMVVTYQANGGTIQNYTQKVIKGDVLSKNSLPTPTRDKYDFIGWYTTSNFAEGTEYADMKITQDTVLYAKWEAVAGAILVEFKLVGANALDVVAMSDFKAQEITETNTKAIRLTEKENGYRNDINYSRYIVGYYLDEACTQAFDFNTTITESTVVYVKWDSKVLVTVSVGSGISSSEVTLDGTKITQTTFYAAKGQTIKATAKKNSFFSNVSVSVSESYGGTSKSDSGYFGATATLTFTATGDTTITMS